MAVLVLMLLFFHGVAGKEWSIEAGPESLTVHMDETVSTPFSVESTGSSRFTLIPYSNTNIATAKLEYNERNDTFGHGNLTVNGVFLGVTPISLSYESKTFNDSKKILTVTVIRKEQTVDRVFTASVAILVSILYINFGCAMDWKICYDTLKKPVGPIIGFFCQFLCLPLLSYGIGLLLFPGQPELQLGMFFTGISPSGGASNIWTVLLDGNLNLSITMTTLCTVAAFGMMPLWIFTLGRYIFERGEIVIPYSRIAFFVVGLIIPLAIGFFIQRKLPKLCRILVRIMKPFSIILILFIIIFAIVTNLYLFKLFSIRIVLAGMGLPWLGFIIGMIAALIFKQPIPDVKAISIETGIQNTGVAIFLLRFTLEPPNADLTTVVPVSSAIMTPLPLIVWYIGKSVYNRWKRTSNSGPVSEKLENMTEVSTITRPFRD